MVVAEPASILDFIRPRAMSSIVVKVGPLGQGHGTFSICCTNWKKKERFSEFAPFSATIIVDRSIFRLACN